MAREFSDADFEEQVIQSDQLVIVDFWAEWCGPCRVIGPIVEELGKDYEGKVTVGKINVDYNPDISAKHGILSIPTILFFKKGEVVDRQVGTVAKAVLAEKIEKHL